MATAKKKTAKGVGKPDYIGLESQGRVKHTDKGYDNEPNPTVLNTKTGQVEQMGHVRGESGMRKGLTPEKYLAMAELSERNKKVGKEWDFLPDLEDYEIEIVEKYQKKAKKNDAESSPSS